MLVGICRCFKQRRKQERMRELDVWDTHNNIMRAQLGIDIRTVGCKMSNFDVFNEYKCVYSR